MSEEPFPQKQWQALDLSPDAIVLVDKDGVIFYFNLKAEQLLGYSSAEVLGRKIEMLIPRECRKLHVTYRKTFVENPRAYCSEKMREVTALCQDGSELPVDIRLCHREVDGIELVCVSIRDASLRLEWEAAIESRDTRYRDLLEAMSEGFGEADRDYTLTYVNPGFCEMLGRTNEEIVGKPLLDFVHEEHKGKMRKQIQLRRQGVEQPFELIFSHKNGERVYTWASPKAVFDENRNFLGSFGVLTNLTEMKKEQRALKLSEERFRTLVETIPYGIQESDLSGKIIFSNKAHCAIHGSEEGELLGKAIWDLLCSDTERERTRNYFNDLIENRPSPTPFFVKDKTRDGNIIDIQVDWDYRYDAEGNLAGFISVIKDITERKRVEQDLEQHRHHLEAMVAERTLALEDANKDLESFSYSVSHDLRAPLRAIDGFSQALLEDNAGQIDDASKGYLRRIRSSVQRMGRLIDDMLSLSRVTRCELRQEYVDLSAMAHEVISKYREYEPHREAEIYIEPGIFGWADMRLIEIVLDNLLGNAWKYTGKTDKMRIEFDLMKKGSEIIYRIRDNGVGFDMKYVDKLFGPFQRLHKANEFEGTGIGLATVARIIHRHGGQVWAEAEAGQGATFYFTLGVENKAGE